MRLHQLDLNKLHTFHAVAEQGGVAAAARYLGRTPSAVSQSLSSLERSLELRLFDRVGRRLVPTREGQVLLTRLSDYQSQLQRALDDARNADGAIRGLIRLGLFPGFPSGRLARLVGGFTAKHPEAGVRVVHGTQAELTRRLLRNRLDFVVSLEPQSARSSRVTSVRLFEQELVLVCPRRWFRRGFDADELRERPVIDYYQSNPLIRGWLAHHLDEPPDVEVRVWAATTELVLELLLDPGGVAVVPRHLADPLVRAKRLRIVSTDRPELRDAAWLNHTGESWRGPAVDAFGAAALELLS